MAKEKKIPFRIFIKDTVTGTTHQWESLPEESRKQYVSRMGENAGKVMSEYYSSHIEEFERL